MRMLYNFISVFGEELEIHHDWGYLQFYLMPTYDDILNNKLDNFPKFKRLNSSMERIWDIAFQKEIMIDGKIIKSMEKSWPQAKDDFIEKVTLPLYTKKKITLDQKYDLERLVDSFNRHSWRAAFFIWNIMNIKIHDYRKWNKDFFVKFYLNKKKKVGYSEKVIACFLQQGFKNVDVIPIDTWVESFHKGPLGIFDKADFFKPFSCLGKLERVIWLSSQANKTNMKSFFNLLWCQRYGDTGNNELRRANPIACYECFLKKTCIGMSKIMDLNVLVKDGKTLKIKDLLVAKSGKIKGRILNLKNIATKKVVLQAEKNNCDFICLTINSVPKKIFICKDKSKHIWKLIDEFSGYILKSEKTGTVGKIVTTNELLDSLPPFQK
jgi:hypothetical protein